MNRQGSRRNRVKPSTERSIPGSADQVTSAPLGKPWRTPAERAETDGAPRNEPSKEARMTPAKRVRRSSRLYPSRKQSSATRQRVSVRC